MLVSISVSPSAPSLLKGNTLQFTATGVYADSSSRDLTAYVTWSSSNSAVATIGNGGSEMGLATAIAAGTTTIRGAVANFTSSTTLTVEDFGGVLTYHNDPARTGQNLDEVTLTPANVNVNTFGKLFSLRVDGYLYAQPLYVPGVTIPGKGVHNVVYVATENDTVYAFDADTPGPPLWKTGLLGPGETPVPAAAMNCDDLVPVIGVTSTPVIDRSAGTIYVVAKSQVTAAAIPTMFYSIHALDITTGAERPGSPQAITASIERGFVTFDPRNELNRPGLALVDGAVYIAFGSLCDVTPYHGWLFAYDAATLSQLAVFNSTPNASEGAIWQSGGAPSADSSGNVYVITGNGSFDADSGGQDYGDSFLKLTLSGNILSVIDYFTPFDQVNLSSNDLDLGSADALLLPDSAGSALHPHLLISASKGGTIYLLDRDNMGKLCDSCAASNTQIVQELPGAFSGNYSNPAYWNGLIYFGPDKGSLQAYSIANGVLSPSPVTSASVPFAYPGATPSISANGSSNGILWAIESSQFDAPGPAVLEAYLATNLADELYNSAQAPAGRDTAGDAVKFTAPTIANGKVYVGTQTELDVYGLLP